MFPLTRSVCFLALVWAVCLAAPARAQDPPEPVTLGEEGSESAPAHINFVEGRVSLERDGRVERSPANVPLLVGDRVRTQDGRVEILFGDGSILAVDHFTLIDLQSDSLLRLLEGRVRLTVANGAPVKYRVDTPSAWVRIEWPGDYRISLLAPAADRVDTELVVLRGAAELANDSGATLVRAGESAVTLNRAMPSYAQAYNVADWDAFEQWVEDRRQARLGVASSEYLPPELSSYGGTFDSYGSWQSHSSYGFVWYPRVDQGWRPYHHGRWDYYRPYGWTWIGYDPWAWPTHHYGRWGFGAGLWFWIPWKVWGPAWVSWSVSPGFVGWCPRGWNGRPVIGWGVTAFDPWHAWTVVPSRRFVPGFAVARHAVPFGGVPRGTTFVTSAVPPVGVDRAGFAAARNAPLSSMGRAGGFVRTRPDVAIRRTPDIAVPRGTRSPGAVPAMPATALPSQISPDTGRGPIADPRRAEAGQDRRSGRVRDAGVGGPLPETPAASASPSPYAVPRASDPPSGFIPRRGWNGSPDSAGDRAVPRGLPSPSTVPSMPATPLPSEVDRRSDWPGGRSDAPGRAGGYVSPRYGPPPQSSPPARVRPAPPAPEAAPSRGRDQAAPRQPSPGQGSDGQPRAVPRSGGQPSGGQSSGGQSGGRSSGGRSSGAPARGRPGR